MGYRLYSADFKYAVVRAANDGKTLAEINASLAASVSKDSLRRWTDLYKRTRAVVCDPSTYQTQGRTFELKEEDLNFISEMVAEKPTVYLDEIQQVLIEETGAIVCLKTISKTLHERLNMSKKTIRTFNPRQDPEARAYYTSRISCIPTSYLVFTDESGVLLEVVSRTRGWAPVGQRTPRVSRERSTHKYNVIPAIAFDGLVAHMVQEESVNRADFEFFLEHILLPSMNPFPGPRSVVVMDNAQIHHNGRIAELVEERGCLLQYLPAYSPDLNPIEKGFSVYKSNLRRNEDLLTGGEEDYDVLDTFVTLVFTDVLTRKLFIGSGYLAN